MAKNDVRSGMIAMPAGWIQDEEGRWRRETIHHMGRRLPGWDYRRPGYYVITIVLEDRRSMALGELVVRKRPSACADGGKMDGGERDNNGWLSVTNAKTRGFEPEEIEAKVAFSDLGRAIFDHFRKIGEFTPGLKPVYCAVMPDHLHLLLKVERELARPIGNAVGGFKTGCEKIFAKLGGKGRLFAPASTPQGQFGRKGKIPRLAARALGASHELAPSVLQAPAVQTAGRFSAIGNHFLLARPLAQVQISRRFFRYRRMAKPGVAPKIARDAAGEPIAEFSTPDYIALP